MPTRRRARAEGCWRCCAGRGRCQVILVVVVAANLAGGGIDGVALPSLAHARFGAAG